MPRFDDDAAWHPDWGTDAVEREYNLGIHAAIQAEDNDRALELSVGLRQYQTLYKER